MKYPHLSLQSGQLGDYSLVPIRMEDRELIRQWRNEQMYHLRQNTPLTKEDQDQYFATVVKNLFEIDQPKQYLFSYLYHDHCIGYGGLVHIDYDRKTAELSFIMKTELEQEEFGLHWGNYLSMIRPIAFQGLTLRKIFTYAYDLRPHLYPVLEGAGFLKEREIPDALQENGRSIPAMIHSLWNAKLRRATPEDIELTFQWANHPEVRTYSFSQEPIPWEDHVAWFTRKLADSNCLYYLLESPWGTLGSIRFDLNAGQPGMISYLLDPKFHGQGWGTALLILGEQEARRMGVQQLFGDVLPENQASCAIFAKLGYEKEVLSDRIRYMKFL